MAKKTTLTNTELPTGVMLNAYPDSIGKHLSDSVDMLKRPEFKDVFSLFYILPTFFNSDLDRGFSIIDYNLNQSLVSESDLKDFQRLKLMLKFDLVLNHLSVGSPQFQDMLQHGDYSKYKDFFIDWNEFWDGHGEMGKDGYIIPKKKYLDKLFMRKPELPILQVRFPDGSYRSYWNTFYQAVSYEEIDPEDLAGIQDLTPEQAEAIVDIVNDTIRNKADIKGINLGENAKHKDAVLNIVEQHYKYLGQMDLNAKSEGVWEFYDDTLRKLRDYGCRLVRLDAFAYLHKEVGQTNFFNQPGTWEYLDRLKAIADKYDVILLPEIHSEYGTGLHEEIAGKGFPIYDFFFPGLLIDALDRGLNTHLARWIKEITKKGIQTVNMLGCHDGIPVLDLRGKKQKDGGDGLLSDEDIQAVIDRILSRGGRIKNLYGADGNKIAYYQVNATFFSALGEDEQKMLLARAIQMFMPGIPQVWYLDLFAGTNDYIAADRGGPAGHKEINRTALSLGDIDAGLKKLIVKYQLDLIRIRNTSAAFGGKLKIGDTPEHILEMTWQNGDAKASLKANLRSHCFHIEQSGEAESTGQMCFD